MLEETPVLEMLQEELPIETSTVPPQQLPSLKNVIEALLFATSEPISFQKIKNIVSLSHSVTANDLKAALQELQAEYLFQNRAFNLETIAQGYILRTRPEYSSYIVHLYKNKRTEKLSKSTLETLAIIAYKQPITRAEIEEIRGVDSSGVVLQLQERELIEPVGRLEAPGKPTLFGTTKKFLQYFGLNDVKDLPQVLPSKKAIEEPQK